MMRKSNLLIISAVIVLFSCQQDNSSKNQVIPVTYPTTKVVDHVDNYHGNEVSDPYRWLEIDTASEVEEWVDAQNAVTSGYLEQIPYRDAIEKRYEELYNYPKLSSPSRVGEYYFFYKNEGLQNQPVIYRQKGLDGEPEVFIDPNAYSEDGTTAIYLIGFSNDDRYVAYAVQEGGSDWLTMHVKEVASGKQLDDEINWVKFSGAAWFRDGFYYSRYPESIEGLKLSQTNQFHSVYYHKLGTDQSQDVLIYEDRDNPTYLHSIWVPENEKYLVLYVSSGTDGFETYFKDATVPGSAFQPIYTGFSHKNSVVKALDDGFFVMTDVDAPNYRLVKVLASSPEVEEWQELIPEKDNLLSNVSTGGQKLFAHYLEDVKTKIFQFDFNGQMEKEIQLPGLGSAGGFGGKDDDQILFYSYTSFLYPPTIFKYEVESGQSDIFYKTELEFNPDEYVEEQVFYTSKDGTKVPMFIVRKKNLKMDGSNPTYLYGYGGFSISLSPGFSSSRIVLLENGGIYAQPSLRGGGEYGEEWHKAGMLLKKQNVFDDFIAAAEYLISEGYTSPEKLAIAGGSNGGLLVGAAMTQRPELFGVAFPAVGVLDMLRYHKFTIGHAWAVEYGSSDDPQHFENLLSYSPLHNLREGTKYPSTMVTTADHDDRVVPAHSFKFAAELQRCHEGENPVIIRIEKMAGHGSGKPTSKIIEEVADQWAFFFYNTNSPVKYMAG